MENDEQKPVWKRIEYFSNMTIKLWLSKVTLGQSFKKEEIIKMVISNTIKGKSSFHFVVPYIIQYCATKTSWANTWKYPEATRQHLCSTLLLVTQNGLTLTVLDDLATFVQEENGPIISMMNVFKSNIQNWYPNRGVANLIKRCTFAQFAYFVLREIGIFFTSSGNLWGARATPLPRLCTQTRSFCHIY